MKRQLTIIGGGITGLAAAYLAAKGGASVRVLEGSSKFGGLLNTFEIGGSHLEYYYHHFFTHDAEINWLIRELGIEDKLVFRNSTMGVFRNGQLYDFNTPLDLLKFHPISFLDKIRFGVSSVYLGKMVDWRDVEDVSALEWFYRWAGRGTTEALWKPLLDIKFGPYAPEVPLSWMAGRLGQRMNSRKGGKEQLGYLEGSLKTLLDALLRALEKLGVTLHAETPITGFIQDKGVAKGVKTPKGDFTEGDFLATIPTVYLTPLLKQPFPQLAKKLDQIEYFGAVCTILELDRPLSEVYWMNVADEGFPFGGIIEQTNLIAPEVYGGRHIVYLSRYFAANDALSSMDNKATAEKMLAPLPRIYPDFKREWLKDVHVFKTPTAATVCDLNFYQKVPSCDTGIPHLYICNMAHIYPDERSVNNSIRIAAEACRVLELPVPSVPANASLSGQIGFGQDSSKKVG